MGATKPRHGVRVGWHAGFRPVELFCIIRCYDDDDCEHSSIFHTFVNADCWLLACGSANSCTQPTMQIHARIPASALGGSAISLPMHMWVKSMESAILRLRLGVYTSATSHQNTSNAGAANAHGVQPAEVL